MPVKKTIHIGDRVQVQLNRTMDPATPICSAVVIENEGNPRVRIDRKAHMVYGGAELALHQHCKIVRE